MEKVYVVVRVVEPGNFKLFFKSEVSSVWEEKVFENVTAMSFCPSEPKVVYWVRWIKKEGRIFVQRKDEENDDEIEEKEVDSEGVAFFD